MPSQFDIDSFVLRRRSDNEFVALTDEIYPLEIENEIFLVRGIVDYLHTNKGIKCQSSVSASKKFVAAFLDVEIDPEFKKYVHYASHLPVVENTYPHVINRWVQTNIHAQNVMYQMIYCVQGLKQVKK